MSDILFIIYELCGNFFFSKKKKKKKKKWFLTFFFVVATAALEMSHRRPPRGHESQSDKLSQVAKIEAAKSERFFWGLGAHL